MLAHSLDHPFRRSSAKHLITDGLKGKYFMSLSDETKGLSRESDEYYVTNYSSKFFLHRNQAD